MLFFMLDRDHFVMTNASAETIREFWNNFHAYRYDVMIDFDNFLKENGVYARSASPDLSAFGYSIDDIEIYLN